MAIGSLVFFYLGSEISRYFSQRHLISQPFHQWVTTEKMFLSWGTHSHNIIDPSGSMDPWLGKCLWLHHKIWPRPKQNYFWTLFESLWNRTEVRSVCFLQMGVGIRNLWAIGGHTSLVEVGLLGQMLYNVAWHNNPVLDSFFSYNDLYIDNQLIYIIVDINFFNLPKMMLEMFFRVVISRTEEGITFLQWKMRNPV